MSEDDRARGGEPSGGSRDGGPAAEASRLRVYPGGGEPRAPRRPSAAPVGEVSERLTALESQVEEALARSSVGGGAVGHEVVRAALEETLAGWASLRRWTWRETLGTLRPSGAPSARLADALLRTLYRYWWRVETVGLGRVPASGRLLLVANRAGALLPYEALMIAIALADAHAERRRAHPVLEEWVAQAPLVGAVIAATGAVRGSAASLRRLLEREEAVIVCPEGAAAVAKGFGKRYRLARFGRSGFARLAIETGTPIVPVAVIGAEETHPVLACLDAPGRLLGLPTLPITPTFPWLGLFGLVPLPTKWTLHFGEPLDVAARHPASEAGDAARVARLRDQVRERLQGLVVEGLRRRRSIFLG